MKRYAAVLSLALFLLLPTSVAAADCQFVLGFKTLRDLVGHEIVGECLENEHYNEIGDSVQQTTGGLLVWRKADNWTAFTDGYRSWINGPNGLEQRLNTERFEWEVENMIAALPHNPRDPTPVEDLRQIGQISSPVFLAFLERAGDKSLSSIEVRMVLNLARLNKEVTLQLMRMPFMRTRDQGSDFIVIRYAIDLARSDLAALHRILSHSELDGGITDDHVATFVLLVLGETRAEAAAAIQSLPWVQDGVGRAPFNYQSVDRADPKTQEEWVVISLATIAEETQDAALALVGKPWLQDELERWETQSIVRLSQISQNDAYLALQLVGMPFLDSITFRDSGILATLFEVLVSNVNALPELLAHPELRGGITDNHYDLVKSLAMEATR